MAIRDGKLYRASFGTFEEYCRERWDLRRAHAYRLIAGAKVMAILSPTGDIKITERQMRVLSREPIELARKIWRRAIGNANGAQMTGRILQSAADEIRGRKRKGKRKEFWQLSSEAAVEKLGRTIRRGDRSEAIAILTKIELLLTIGVRGDGDSREKSPETK